MPYKRIVKQHPSVNDNCTGLPSYTEITRLDLAAGTTWECPVCERVWQLVSGDYSDVYWSLRFMHWFRRDICPTVQEYWTKEMNKDNAISNLSP